MAQFQLTESQRSHLSSTSQRFELYVAFTSPFLVTATSVRPNDPSNPPPIDNFVWRPVVRMGPNRVGVRGSAIQFYGGDSYLRGGGAASGHSWDFGDGATGSGATVSHSYSAPGLYQVSLTVNDGAGQTNTGYRWVRVYPDWHHAYDGVAEVKSLGGSLSQGGWQCQLKVTGDTSTISDRMGVILYAKDYWSVDKQGNSVADTVGLYPERYDPGIVMTGYVVGDTIQVDANTHSVTFEVRTPEVLLQEVSVFSTDFWNDGEKGRGHFIPNLQYADAIQHMFTEHTNFAAWHDVVLWQDTTTPNVIRSITLNEGSLWSWVQDMAKNEFGQVYCDKNSALYIMPNVNVRGFSWWGSQTSPVMDFNAENIIQLSITEQPANRVGYVEIVGSKSIGGQEDISVMYPLTPGPAGKWEIIREIMCDDRVILEQYARRIYNWRNSRYTAQLVTGLNHALDVGQVITLTYTSEQ
jgi:hypothetical protein